MKKIIMFGAKNSWQRLLFGGILLFYHYVYLPFLVACFGVGTSDKQIVFACESGLKY